MSKTSLDGAMWFLLREPLREGESEDDERVVAVFAVHDALDLYYRVDEMADPRDFQYARVGCCGGVWATDVDDGGVSVLQRSGSWQLPNTPLSEEFDWKTFDQLIKQPFDDWYANVYLPAVHGGEVAE